MKQSAGVYSLNHDTTTSFGIHLTPIFKNFAPTLHRYYSLRVHIYAHPQHMDMKVINTLLIIHIKHKELHQLFYLDLLHCPGADPKSFPNAMQQAQQDRIYTDFAIEQSPSSL